MSERRGTKALEVWCKRVTDGYPGVKVENMTTSWRDGLAFCAMIHHFRPDLIDFNSLDKRDVYRNNELAFSIAERHLGIPALLDAEDMVEYEVPDRLSMLTYLSQFYQTFVGQQGNSPNQRTPAKRSSVSPSLSSSPDLSPSMSPTSSSPPTKVQARGAGAVTGSASRSHRDPCTHCGLPVFLAERLIVGNKRCLYHRTCFRCARCSAQLTLANCYETEEGHFCCETCPDEENDRSDSSSFVSDRLDCTDNKCDSVCSFDETKTSYYCPRSDDEKSIGLNADEYSTSFESALDHEHHKHSRPKPQLDGSAPLAPSHVTDDLDSKSEDVSLKILPSSFVHSNATSNDALKDSAPVSQNDELSRPQTTKESTVPISNDVPKCKNEELPIDMESCQHRSNEMFVSKTDSSVNTEYTRISKHQHVTASTVSGADNFTKDSQVSSADHNVSSIVKLRKMMFEAESQSSNTKYVPSPKRISDNFDKGNQMSKITSKSTSDSEEMRGSSVTFYSKVGDSDTSDVLEREAILPSEREESVHVNNEEDKREEEDGNTAAAKEKDAAEIVINKYLDPSKGPDNVIDTSLLKIETQSIEFNAVPPESGCVKPPVSPRKVFLSPKHSHSEPKKDPALLHSLPTDYPSELNPFGEEDEGTDAQNDPLEFCKNDRSASVRISTNPFGSSDEEEEDSVVLRRSGGMKPPRPPPPQSRGQLSKPVFIDNGHKNMEEQLTTEPTSNSNPFGTDGEETAESEMIPPVPRPRTVWLTPEPSPRANKSSAISSSIINSSGRFGSTSSLASLNSSCSTTNRRSKKPAPAPPSVSLPSKSDSLSLSPYSSLNRSPHRRKSRPAPPPPRSSLLENSQQASLNEHWDQLKIQKDEANRNKQAVEKDDLVVPRDKSTYGQWKRKKGPAPPRPVPQRREVRAMPLKELKRELDDIEVKQQELERQGVKLEQTIRFKFEEAPKLLESSITPDVEILVLQLFELVNEKNELFRKQAELMYLRRQHRLEEEHAELEYQIRCLMEQPERNKTDSDKAKEEELIQRLVEVVERRNEIIECLDMDRLREAEEDNSIHTKLGQFAAKGIDCGTTGTPPGKPKKEKKKKKEKESKKKKDSKPDADKDIDEIEAAAIAAAAKEKKTKKKWF